MVDASVIAKWFKPEGESHLAEAYALRQAALRGELALAVPVLLFLELLNTAARRWRWSPTRLEGMAGELDALPFLVATPSLIAVARWASLGLSAYDSSYVAIAERQAARLVTTDEQIISVAPTIALHLRDYT